MEDAATAEICRSQIWQWVHNDAKLSDGTQVTADLVRRIVAEELVKLGDAGEYRQARETFEEVALADEFIEFLTLPAYERMP
jgi:malate synthase